tara:strand:- start:1574 stop:1945 length:372 start_codon:yes stop_codon:yes gene_type:complete
MSEALLGLGIVLLMLIWIDLFLHEVPIVRKFRGWIAGAATLLLLLSRFGRGDDDDPVSFGPSTDVPPPPPPPTERFTHEGSIDEVETERQRDVVTPVDVDPDDDLGAFRDAAKRDGVLSGDDE